MTPDDLVGAPEEMLKEIQRQAESQLAAQLQAGTAADARALSFISLMAGATVVVAGGAAAFLTGSPRHLHLGIDCIGVAVGFVISICTALISARPTGFDYVGSWPSMWVGDVKDKKQCLQAIAEQLAELDERVRRNSSVLVVNAWCMRSALVVAVLTLVVGGTFFACHLSPFMQRGH